MVLDRTAACVKIYDRDGGFIGRMGRRGSAPGELLNPISFAVLGDGRTVIIDPWRGGLFSWSSDFEYQRQFGEMNNHTPAMFVGSSDSGFIAGKVTPEVVNDRIMVTTALLRYEMSAEPVLSYRDRRFELDPMDMATTLENTLFWGSYTSDRDGNVYFALMEPDDYTIVGLRRDGTEFMTIEHPTESVAKTEDEMADERAYILARLEGWNAQWGIADYQPQPMRNQVRALPGVDSEGRLWALRGTREDPTFDVFDSRTGERLFGAVLPDIGYDGLFWSFRVDEHGILAWSEIASGYPQVYMLTLLE
jgi:hypothetical protein